MIVLEVNVDSIFAIKGERQSQVAGHGDRPTSFLITKEAMQPPARNVHVFCAGGSIQAVQHSSDPRTMFAGNPARRACGEQLTEAFVTEVADHITSEVNSNALLYSLSSKALQTVPAVSRDSQPLREIIVAIREQRFSLPAYKALVNDTGFPLPRE